MADCKSKSGQKRRREDDINPEAKRPKLVPAAETAETTEQQGLRKFCEHLDLEDLLTVANVNTSFNAAASLVFIEKHGHKRIIIDGAHVGSCSSICYVFQEQIFISGLRTALQFLRSFGHCITKLDVCYLEISKPNCARINKYIQKYCTKSLTDINLLNAPEFLKDTKESFSKIESVSVYRGNLASRLPQFGKWFPNLRRLYLLWNKNYVDTFFPHLEHLSVMIPNSGPDDALTLESVSALIHSNHLKSLEIKISPISVTFNVFMRIIGIQPLITKLVVLNGITSLILDNQNLAKFVNALPSLIELDLKDFTLTPDAAIAYIRQFKCLKKFRFKIAGFSREECLRLHLGNEWQMSVEYDVVNLERKDDSAVAAAAAKL